MFCFGLLQNHGPKTSTSWISLTFLCSVLCMWTSVESWSYYYSNTTMNWQDARAFCQMHYTDMVAIQNQDEIAHLSSWLPKKPTYYWIGIRRINGRWTWVGTNKVLTMEAANWARGEPNNGKTGQITGSNEDCVEMYIKRDFQAGKWNDERCDKLKTAVCYTAACKNDSCLHGECVETINSHKCACFDGFYGVKCEQVVQCDKEEVTVPYKASVNCTHKYGDYTYNSSCQYSCEEGYQLSTPGPMICNASKQWSEKPPTCELVQCQELSSPVSGSMECFDPLGPSSYKSTCVFTCEEGYVLRGSPSNTLQCEASGFWNSSEPFCVAVQCPAIQGLENGAFNCGDNADMRFSFGNNCSFSCADGYRLVGPSTVTCTSAAMWNERIPHCEAITCQKPEVEAHLVAKCNKPLTELRPDSTCSFSCEVGFELQGAHTLHCSENGQWSKAIPTCKAIVCPAPEVSTNVQISCGPSSSSMTLHPFGMVCTFSCDEGHELQGAPSMECTHQGQWTSTPPNCIAMRCPLLEAPENGHVSCSHTELLYNSQCSFTCDKGYSLEGNDMLICDRHGNWNGDKPICQAMRCPLLEAPENGHVNCSHTELVYNSQCSFTCNKDYSLEGHDMLICDHHGNWTGDKPICQAAASPVTAIASSVATGGTLLSGLSVAMWLLKRMRKKATKFELNSNSDIEVPPQVYKNSIDSLI